MTPNFKRPSLTFWRHSSPLKALILIALVCTVSWIAAAQNAPATGSARVIDTAAVTANTRLPQSETQVSDVPLNPDPKSAPVINSNALRACDGNASDECKTAPSIDFYPGGSEGATNPKFNSSAGDFKEIMGRITTFDSFSIILSTTSGRLFTIQFPLNSIAEFNTNRSPNYQGLQVTAGDMVYVSYVEPPHLSGTTVSAEQLFKSSLILKDTNPKTNLTIEKY